MTDDASGSTARRILIVGASGLVGSAAVSHFHDRPGWEVVALSRRPLPDWPDTVRHFPIDLLDESSCRRASESMPPVTHLFYSALYEEPELAAGWQAGDHTRTNVSMLESALDLAEQGGRLEHVTIMQGGKAYGSHLGPTPVPAKERWPRMPFDIFYWPQEDLLRERARTGSWRFNILRPQIILGLAEGSPMNTVAAIGAYASIRRELGLPLSFPGGGRYVTACTDSRLIAQAANFCAEHAEVDGETFNVVNGDATVWHDLWPAIAAHFGMAIGEPEPMRLAEHMPRHRDLWTELATRESLRNTNLDEMLRSSWQMADLAFGAGDPSPADRLMSPIKLRQAGFDGCYDTEDSVLYWLGEMQKRRMVPSAPAERGQLPDYAALKRRTDAPPGSSWGVFGNHDQLGTLNLLGPRQASRAASLVTRGATFSLDYPLDAITPPLSASRGIASHSIVRRFEGQVLDDRVDFNTQITSQLDGLRHHRHPVHGFYGGVHEDEIREGSTALGIQHASNHGIVGRGVLLDIGRHLANRGEPLDLDAPEAITVEMLDSAASTQGVRFESGDILLLHTGWARHMVEDVSAERRAALGNAPSFCGLAQTEETLAWIWDNHFAVVASDTFAVEVMPPLASSPFTQNILGMIHPDLIALLGVSLGEMWNLGALAQDCARDGIYECLVTAKPLNLTGGVASPANAMAIK